MKKKSEWKKNCPECDKNQYYVDKTVLKTSIKNNTCCRSCSKKGINNPQYEKSLSKEIKQKMSRSKSGENHYMYGKHHTEKTKDKIRKGNINKIVTENTKQRIRENHAHLSGKNHPMYGKPRSEETCRKISENHVGMSGKKHTEETKRKMRLLHIKRIEEKKLNGGQLAPNYNRKACILFDWANMYHDLHIQHAENGGEFYLKEEGYYADGYDATTNTWYEYYEKYHKNPKQVIRDEQRKQNIIKRLNCEFIEIKEWENN